MIREYLKLARSFNSFLTGLSPVMGALAMEQYDIFTLFLLFLIGFLGHTYGFVVNDIIDSKIDKLNKEISDRPLISGTISIRKAWIFAIVSMIIAFILAIYLCYEKGSYIPLIVLFFSALIITIYDYTSKKLPLMDILSSTAVFLLIIFGATTVTGNLSGVTTLAWIVGILGWLEVFFMQIVTGGLKDLKSDFKVGAKTAALKLGVRVNDNNLFIMTYRYKFVTYLIQILNLFFVYLPFFIIFTQRTTLHYIQFILFFILGFLMLFISHRFLNFKYFERAKMRKLFGIHFSINFSIVPILLMVLNPWTLIIIIFPPIGFIFSNLILHGTFLQPKTM
jgi:4-hydroxybenzoate polyprenyltransferase